MGCGASQQEQQQEQGPKPLTAEEKTAIAVQALKDAMGWALDQSIVFTSQLSAWEDPEIKIKVPVQDKIDNLLEKVGSVPMIGSSLADALRKTTEPFEESFADAGRCVAADAKTRRSFTDVIDGIQVEDAIKLCRSGGVSACVDYVKEKGAANVKVLLEPIVAEIMNEHALTKVWTGFIEKYNAAASKVSAVDPIEFNLNLYVLECAMDGVFTIMMRKEKEIRAAPGQAVSAAVQQAFGKDPSEWKRN